MINNKKKEIRKLVFSIVRVTIFLILMTTCVYLPKQENLLSSLAFLQNQRNFYMEDVTSGILLKDANPMTDKKGLQLEPYQFKVVNDTNADITYHIIFQNNEEKAKKTGKEILPNRYLKYSLQQQDQTLVTSAILPEDGILYTTTIKAHTEEIFDFRMWLDWNADNGAMNKIFIGKIRIVEIEK